MRSDNTHDTVVSMIESARFQGRAAGPPLKPHLPSLWATRLMQLLVQRGGGRLGRRAEGAQRAFEVFEGGVDQRAVAVARGQAHKLRGGALAAAVDLEDLLVVVDRHMRRVALGRLGQ